MQRSLLFVVPSLSWQRIRMVLHDAFYSLQKTTAQKRGVSAPLGSSNRGISSSISSSCSQETGVITRPLRLIASRQCFEVSLRLSRACLGKSSIIYRESEQMKGVSHLMVTPRGSAMKSSSRERSDVVLPKNTPRFGLICG